MKRLVLHMVTGVLLAGAASAQTLETIITPGNELTVGEPAVLRINTGAPMEILPNDESSLGGIEILSKDSASEGDNHFWLLHVIAFDSGNFVMPPVAFYFQDSIHYTDSIPLRFNLMEVDTSGDVMDIKPIFDADEYKDEEASDDGSWFSRNWGWLLAIAILAFMVIAVIFSRKRKLQKPVRVLPPHEAALLRITQLRQSNLIAQGKHKQYHIELSDIIRQYAYQRFGVNAMEQTTDELIKSLRGQVREKNLLVELKATLKLSDLVKFARLTPSQEESDMATDKAVHFVEVTTIFNPEQEQANEVA